MTVSHTAKAEELYQKMQALYNIPRQNRDEEWCLNYLNLRDQRVACVDDLFYQTTEDLRLRRDPDEGVLNDRVTAIKDLKEQWPTSQDMGERRAELTQRLIELGRNPDMTRFREWESVREQREMLEERRLPIQEVDEQGAEWKLKALEGWAAAIPKTHILKSSPK